MYKRQDQAGPSTVLQTVPPLTLALRELLAALSDAELARLSDAARPGPWRAYETVQADNFIVEERQGLLNGPGPVMGPSYDRSTTEYVVALVNLHRATLEARP